MPTIRTRLYPIADISEHDQVSFYSMDVTGLAGALVKIVTGAANPQNADGWAVGSSVGAQVAFFQAISQRYETKFKVTNTVSGDSNYNAFGFTLQSTLEYDENGQPLRYNRQRANEIGAVISGETIPIARKASVFGIWGQYIDSSLGNVQPGNLVVVSRSGNGQIASVDPKGAFFNAANTTGSAIYNGSHVIGKWMTSLPTSLNSGIANEFSAQGGYALFSFDLTK